MHKQKRALISITAIILCAVTLLGVASAGGYTIQDATTGIPPQPLLGASNSTPNTCFDNNIIAGYRFTCWRSEDYAKAANGSLTGTPITGTALNDYHTQHNEPGYKLGHSINILINTHDAWHYSNNHGQTKNNAPRMYVNGDSQDYLDKITTAQLEMKSDGQPDKWIHAVKTNFATLQYAGDVRGYNIDGGSTFKFTTPLLSKVEQGELNEDPKQSLLGGATVNANKDNPVTIYSGYEMYSLTMKSDGTTPESFNKQNPLNPTGDFGTQKDNEFNNLFTYIYGIDYSDQHSTTGGTGTDYAKKGYLTIADVDDHTANVNYGSQKVGSVVAFNQNPANILNSNNPNSWTNMNSSLIATLCGLKPIYGSKTESHLEFGLYDYIIVEPIFSFYYSQKYFMATATDIAMLYSESQSMYFAEKQPDGTLVSTKDCWDVAHNKYKITWFPNAPFFPGAFGTYLYATDYYFGVDGVLDARYESPASGGKNHAFVSYSNRTYKVDFDGMKKFARNEEAPANSKYAYVNANTHAVVYSTGTNHNTLFAGKGSWWYNDDAVRDRSFVTPRVACESMIGAGTWMCGQNLEPKYQIIYHSNFDDAQDMSAENVAYTVSVDPNAKSITFPQYTVLKDDKGNVKTAAGKIGTALWTDIPQKDNRVNDYTGTKYQASQRISISSVPDWFNKHNALKDEHGTFTVHLYAAWDTKALITTLDRTYSSDDAQDNLANALSYNQCYNSNITGIALITPSGTVVPFTQAIGQEYLWQPTGDISTGGTIIYSFHKTTEELPTDEEAINTILRHESHDWAVYAVNGQAIQWDPADSLFYFDFYSFSIEAPNCDIVIERTNIPNGSNTERIETSDNIPKSGEAGDFAVVRGSMLKYQLIPQGEYTFSTDAKAGSYNDYTNLTYPHIKTIPENLPLTTQSAKELVYGATDSNTNFEQTNYKTMLGKEEHRAQVLANAKLTIIPYLNNIPVDPFSSLASSGLYYKVKLHNVKTGKDLYFSTNPNQGGAVNHIDGKDARLEYSVPSGSVYTIQVSHTDSSGFDNLYTFITTDPITEDIVIVVPYYTISALVTTQTSGNHTGISTTITAFTKDAQLNGNDDDLVIGMSRGQKVPSSSTKTDTMCAQPYDDRTSLIVLGSFDYETEVRTKVRIERNDNTDWYLHNGYADSTKRFINGEVAGSGDDAIGNGYYYDIPVVQGSATHLEYVYNPYHYISYSLDDKSVSPHEILSGLTDKSIKLGQYDIIEGADGIKTLRGEAGARASVHALITPNKTTYDVINDAVTHSKEQVIRTTLRYYTVTVDADDGYTANGQQIYTPLKNTAVGTKAYIYSSNEAHGNYTPCDGFTGGRTYYSHTNNLTYPVKATLLNGRDYKNTSVSGRLTAYGEVVGTDKAENKNFTGGITTEISHVIAPSSLYFRSQQDTTGLKFIFRINGVPYDSLPETIHDSISLNGSEPLTFSIDEDGNVIATGEAPVGQYYLYLAGMNTGLDYDVKSDPQYNVYYVDFYTFRVAAGRGIDDVSLSAPTPFIGEWNGTLTYIRNGKVVPDALAVLPKSMTANNYISINAVVNDTKIDGAPKYTFNRWDTQLPKTSPSNIQYTDGGDMTSTTKENMVQVHRMNHAVIVQAEATPDDNTVTPPPIPEHNVKYYTVVVRTFLDGRIVTPWDGLTTDIEVPAFSYTSEFYNGLARWSDVLDEVVYNTNTPVYDQYLGQLAHATVAPSQEFSNNPAISNKNYYHNNTALITNRTVYIDAYYYTQTFQATVNGINMGPWQNADVQYQQYYQGVSDDEVFATLNTAGTASTIMLKDMQLLTVSGTPYEGATDSTVKYTNYTITGAHTFVLPYYSVTMKSVLVQQNATTDIYCPSLTFQNINMQSPQDTPRITKNVMAGTYDITTGDSDGKHIFREWTVSENNIYELKYEDSGTGSNPYPTLVYTGKKRPSTSTINSLNQKQTTIHINDETNLIARYTPVGSKNYTLTLNSVPTYICTECFETHTCSSSCANIHNGENKLTCHNKTMQSVFALYQAGGHVENGATLTYPAGTNVSVHATLQAPIQYHSLPVSVTLTLNGSVNVIKDEAHTLYYATVPNSQIINQRVTESQLLPAEQRPAFLAQYGIIELLPDGNGKYSGNLPYNESQYYLYIDGVKQSTQYNITSQTKTQYRFDDPIWTETDIYNNGNTSQFTVTMNENHEYTVHAKKDTTDNSTQNRDFTVDFVDVTIYVSTNFQTRLPYLSANDLGAQVSNTYISINGASLQIPTNCVYTKRINKNDAFILYAQRTENSIDINVPIHNGYIQENTSFLLSYYSVTVKGDPDVSTNLSGYPGPITKYFLGHYAINGDKEFHSVDTKVDIAAEIYNSFASEIALHNSQITINATAGHKLSLVATEAEHTGYDTHRNLSGLNGAYYVYLLKNTPNNCAALDGAHWYSPDGKFVFGLSKSPNITGNELDIPQVVYMSENVACDIFIDWEHEDFYINASAGVRYDVMSDKESYVFENMLDGYYEVYINDVKLLSGEQDVNSAEGAASIKDDLVVVHCTAVQTLQSNSWLDALTITLQYGKPNTNCVIAGDKIESTKQYNDGTPSDSLRETVDSKQTYYFHSKTHIIPDGNSTGMVSLKDVHGYTIKVFVDGVLANPFGGNMLPVKWNGSPVAEYTTGKSDTLYSIGTPIVQAKANDHDGVYSIIFYGTDSDNIRSAIEYDENTREYKVYYYSVRFKVSDEELGFITSSSPCTREDVYGPVIVAKYSVVTNDNNGPIITVGQHNRQAVIKYDPSRFVEFSGWTRSNMPYAKCTCSASYASTSCGYGNACSHFATCDNCKHAHNGGKKCVTIHELTEQITCPTVFVATFVNTIDRDYTVTLNNKTDSYSMYQYDATTQVLTQSTIYSIYNTDIKNGSLGLVLGPMPSKPTIQDKFTENSIGALHAYVSPAYIERYTSSTVNVTINLSSASSVSRVVVLENINDPHIRLEQVIQPGEKQAVFSVDSGYYQLYIDGKKSTHQFSYNTHGTDCKVGDVNGNLVTPSYSTGSDNAGIIYVAPRYFVVKNEVKSWSQTRNGQEYFDFTQLSDLEPTISYTYICYHCAPSHEFSTDTPVDACEKCGDQYGLYMLSSQLITPEITEDLIYNVYSERSEKLFSPQDIELTIDSNYSVTIYSVLDWQLQPVFAGTRVSPSYARIEYSTDNWLTSETLTQRFVNGKVEFSLPSDAEYKILGASANEFNPDNFVNTGFSSTYATFTANTPLTNNVEAVYYVHYFTVTANSGSSCIYDVNVNQNNAANTLTASAIFQRGTRATINAALSGGSVPVSITVLKDGSPYKNRQVYLSTSETHNTQTVYLTYNPATGTYDNNTAVYDPWQQEFYVWVDGQYVSKVYTDQYTNTSFEIDPYVGFPKWYGNSSGTYKTKAPQSMNLSFVVLNTTEETATITSSKAINATIEYYTLSTEGDSGILNTIGNGTYLKDTLVDINAALKSTQQNQGQTELTVKLFLDGKPFTGQTVTIGGSIAIEYTPGIYTSNKMFPCGQVCEVKILGEPNVNLAQANTIIGYVSASSERTYQWHTWCDKHSACNTCNTVGNCCEDSCVPTKLCTNCRYPYLGYCCIRGSDHTWSECPDNCAANLQNDRTQRINKVLMSCTTALKATTTYQDVYTMEGDANIHFYSLRLDGDAGIQSITAHGVVCNPAQNITNHGATGTNWTDTKHTTTNFTNLIVLAGSDTKLNATVKAPVKNHHEARTALSVTLTLNGNPYRGCVVTIGGALATETAPGVYTTQRADFTGGHTYDIVVNGRPAGRLHLVSYRTYRWNEWSEPWGQEAHYCEYHGEFHNVNSCLALLRNTNTIPSNTVLAQSQFAHLVARTEIIDEFHSYIDPNQPGGPDPYKDPGTPDDPTNDPDDPYKDPTDPDFDTTKNPEQQPNPEYDPNNKPEPNPDYDPSNPTNPDYDPEDDENFDPYDEGDGFFEDAPIPFFTVTIKTTLNGSKIDFVPVKFENLTTGDTLYIFPQNGNEYVIYDGNAYTPDENGNVVFTNNDGHTVYVTINQGLVDVVLQDGDKYRISAMDEFEDANQNDTFDKQDIDTNDITKYTYNEFKSGTIKGNSHSVHVPYYTLTVNVYNNGKLGMPTYGYSVSGASRVQFPAPVWVDDVDDILDGDNYDNTMLKPVNDAKTVKVYLSGQPYNVDAKTSCDDEQYDAQNSKNLVDHKNGFIHYPLTVNVYYWSISIDHFGGFKSTTIHSVNQNDNELTVTANTGNQATSNAMASAYFLQGQRVTVSAALADKNQWIGWDSTPNYNATSTWDGSVDYASQSVTFEIKKEYNLTAHATTTYTVRHFLHAKDNRYADAYRQNKNALWLLNTVNAHGASWREVYNEEFVCEINNRNWVEQTVTGNATQYANFNGYHSTWFASPNATTSGRATGVSDREISIRVDNNQVGGISYVDFYYTRNGTTDANGTPAYNLNKENVKLTYVLGGGTYNGSSKSVVQHYYVGTSATLINLTPPDGHEFLGWATVQPTNNNIITGFVGEGGDPLLMTHDTVLYAVYKNMYVDIGITANDIHGTVRMGKDFTTSATIVNNTKLDFTPDSTHQVTAKLEVYCDGVLVYSITKDDIIVPANGTQLVYEVVPGDKLNSSKEYTITWTLTPINFFDVSYDDNVSSLIPFKLDNNVKIANTARPDYSLNRPSDYNKNTKPDTTSTTVYSWEQWKWEDGKYVKVSSNDQLNITLILKPENENGLRTYTVGAFGMHNYTTRSGYGLSIHSQFSDLNLPYQTSNVHTNNTLDGSLFAVMTFPEFNYSSKYISANGTSEQEYTTLNVSPIAGQNAYRLSIPRTDDYSMDENDKVAHYTPMWLPDGKYTPVTHFGGLWTPLGEMTATVQQGQYTSETDMNKFKIYTNYVIIDGSMYDDLYPNL